MDDLYRKCWVVLLLLNAFYFIESVNANEFLLNSRNKAQDQYYGLIGDNHSYIFNLNTNEAVVIKVTQPNTDLQLKVFKLTADNYEDLIFTSNTSTATWLAETIIVNAKQCTLCKVQIEPVHQGNKQGDYTLLYQYEFVKNFTQYHQLLAMMTKASTLWLNQLDQHKAIEIYQQVIDIAKAEFYDDIYSLALYFQARLYHLLGNQKQYETLLSKTFLNAKASNLYDEKIKMRALLNLGYIQRHNNKFSKANELFNKANVLAIKHGHKLIQAKVIEGRSLIESDQGNYAKALILSEQANAIYIEQGDWYSSIKSLIASGWFYYRQGQTQFALGYFQQALAYATKADLLEDKVDVLTKIATVYRNLGDVEQANHFINQALQDSEKLIHSKVDGWAKQEKARIIMTAGMFELAQDWLNKALAVFNNMAAENDMANIYYFLAINYDHQGEYQLAEKYHHLVLDYDKQSGNQYNIGSAYYRLAYNALKQQKYVKAKSYQQQALQLLANTDDANLLADNYSQAAYIFFHHGDHVQSTHYFQQALKLQKDHQDILGLIQTRYWLAKTKASKGETQQALSHIVQATKYIRDVQKKLIREDFTANFFSLIQKVGDLHVSLLIAQKVSAVDMLTVVESFRTQAFVAKLNREQQTPVIAHDNKLEQDKLHQKLQSVAIKYQQLALPTVREKIVRETRHIIEQLQALYAKQYSLSTDKKTSELYAYDITRIQQGLPDDSVILYFDINKTNSYLWLVNHQQVKGYQLPATNHLLTEITQVLTTLKQPLSSNMHQQHNRQAQMAIKQLSASLFSEVADELVKTKHITIIPDGLLHYLPFSILQFNSSQQSNNQQSNNQQRLVDRFTIAYAPSLSVLQTLQEKLLYKDNRKPLSKFLLVADPKMVNYQENNRNIENNQHFGFYSKELPYTAQEANYISNIIKNNVNIETTVLTREKATKTSLHGLNWNNYQVLHFATHGIANNYQPALGGLVLSNAVEHNNLLLTSEIMNLSTNAELVVLSGCETATGKMIDGEGIFSLSRAFFSAGTKRVIASLWPVQDNVTAKLMQQFYQQLFVEKQPIEKALQQAKQYIKNFKRKNGQRPWKNPYYWAGFVLQGAGGYLNEDKKVD